MYATTKCILREEVVGEKKELLQTNRRYTIVAVYPPAFLTVDSNR